MKRILFFTLILFAGFYPLVRVVTYYSGGPTPSTTFLVGLSLGWAVLFTAFMFNKTPKNKGNVKFYWYTCTTNVEIHRERTCDGARDSYELIEGRGYLARPAEGLGKLFVIHPEGVCLLVTPDYLDKV